MPNRTGAGLVIAGVLMGALSGCASTSSHPAAPQHVGTASLYLPGQTEPQMVRYMVNSEGQAVMGGDIVLGPADQLESLYAAPQPQYTNARHAVAHADTNRLWPGGVIPYEIAPTVSTNLQREIQLAISDVNQTALEVRPRTPMDKDYIVFNVENPSGTCDAVLGRSGGRQTVRINGCGRATITHEILHAAGFDHEHQRSDRDNYVQILWENVQPENRIWLERIDKNRTSLTPYDFNSIMHYQSRAFSSNGQPTIVSRVQGAPVRGVEKLSGHDIEAIARVYGPLSTDSGLPSIFGQIPGLGGGSWPIPGMPQSGGGQPSGGNPFPFPIPQGLPQGMPQNLPQGLPQGLPQPGSGFPALGGLFGQ